METTIGCNGVHEYLKWSGEPLNKLSAEYTLIGQLLVFIMYYHTRKRSLHCFKSFEQTPDVVVSREVVTLFQVGSCQNKWASYLRCEQTIKIPKIFGEL